MAIIGTDIREAEAILRKGGLVGIPTETVYGLAGNALNSEAVVSIFETKNRPSFDPLIVHTDSIEKVRSFVTDIPERALLLANNFWPGPLTILFGRTGIIPDLVTSGMETVAVRIPNHALTLQLLAALDFPLAAPSANPFGYISPTCAAHVNDQLGDSIGYILDGGESAIGIESTIVSFTAETPTILRMGGLTLEDIEKAIGKVEIQSYSTSNPLAPGMLASHYSPRKRFVLRTRDDLLKSKDPNIGYLLFDQYLPGLNSQHQKLLSKSGEVKEAAHHLFSMLRELDKLPVKWIEGELVPEIGLGRAINDRLRRAAAAN